MIKRFCDRCGKEVGAKWFNIAVNAVEEKRTLASAMFPQFANCSNINVELVPEMDFCAECTEQIKAYMAEIV